MEVQLYYRKAKVLRVIDGDTLELDVDWGKKIHTNPDELRMYGIDAPESRRRKPGMTNEEWVAEKAAGLKAKARLQELVGGKTVLIRTIKVDDPTEKYGRLLAEVRLIIKENPDGIIVAEETTVGQTLVGENLAKPYFGGAR